jgi:hypothetical protein
MKRTLIVLVLALFVFSSIGDAQRRRRGRSSGTASSTPAAGPGMVSEPCSASIKSIEDCPDQGCGGSFDAFLNKQKNIRTTNETATDKTLQDLAGLPDPVPGFKKGDPRDPLTALGEGKMIRVTALALVARKGSSETCNCHLTAPKDTDNHIVLVKPSIKNPTLVKNEPDSQTAEFAPRVRIDHPGLAGAKLQALIAATPKKALLVRVTGLQMFDSEHSLGRHLKRHNNWEIHPVMGLEYCPKKTCAQDSDWKNLDQ